MGNLFGKKKPSRVTEHDKAILQIKQQRDKLKQYQSRIENKIESDRQLCKQLLSKGQKERAKLLLKKKKYQEQLLQKTDGQLENVEQMIQDLEFSQVEADVIKGLKVGSEALKKINEVLNIDEIERIMDETREGIEKQQEITDLLNGVLTAEDEASVEEEYAELLALEEAAKIPELPEVPQGEPESTEDIEKISEPTEKKKQKKEEKIALEAS